MPRFHDFDDNGICLDCGSETDGYCPGSDTGEEEED